MNIAGTNAMIGGGIVIVEKVVGEISEMIEGVDRVAMDQEIVVGEIEEAEIVVEGEEMMIGEETGVGGDGIVRPRTLQQKGFE
ncbi:MAG: hypothetical protein AAGC68_00150 [Verrucomicrobiota bacterium]